MNKELKGWRIITRHNEALNRTVYRVFLPGAHDRFYSRPPQWEDFDDYDSALAHYHDRAGWTVVNEEQP